jgi:hypothetical protein
MVSIFPCKQILQDMTLVDIINGIAEKEHTWNHSMEMPYEPLYTNRNFTFSSIWK